MGDSAISGQIMCGNTWHSQVLDAFVCTHAATAFIFASTMLIYPHVFGILLQNPSDFTSVTGDSIRWASPFVFGFSGLAYISLHLPPQNRLQIARLYAACFFLAVLIGICVQSSSRWNSYHSLNIVLFGSLCLVYGVFARWYPQAFTRNDQDDTDLLIMSGKTVKKHGMASTTSSKSMH